MKERYWERLQGESEIGGDGERRQERDIGRGKGLTESGRWREGKKERHWERGRE